jgi:hypothetical protein
MTSTYINMDAVSTWRNCSIHSHWSSWTRKPNLYASNLYFQNGNIFNNSTDTFNYVLLDDSEFFDIEGKTIYLGSAGIGQDKEIDPDSISVGGNNYYVNIGSPYKTYFTTGGIGHRTGCQLDFRDKVFVLTGISGTFTVGETVTGGTSGTTATVRSYDSTNNALRVVLSKSTSSMFTSSEVLTGGSSGATGTISTTKNILPEGYMFSMVGYSWSVQITNGTYGDLTSSVTLGSSSGYFGGIEIVWDGSNFREVSRSGQN